MRTAIFATALALTSLALAGAPAIAAAPHAQEGQPIRWVEAGAQGASLLNLPNPTGRKVLDLASGEVLAVFAETPDFLEVEAPSGNQVWVHGRYLKPTDLADVMEVRGDRISMRPAPNSDVNNYPLPQYLQRGERVFVIERQDAQKDLAEDWVRIWSPPGKHAYVAKAQTRALAASVDGREAWNAARTAALAARVPGGAPKAAPRVQTPEQLAEAARMTQEESARDALEAADALYAETLASGGGDLSAPRAAYEQIVSASPESYYGRRASAQIAEIGVREELSRMRDEVQLTRETNRQRQEELLRQLEEANRAKNDPLAGRFQARGWLEREARRGEEDVFTIRWAGETLAEVVCTSGRYDLALFEGCEVGVVGGTSRAAIPASAGARPRPIQFDTLKLEVLSARPTR